MSADAVAQDGDNLKHVFLESLERAAEFNIPSLKVKPHKLD